MIYFHHPIPAAAGDGWLRPDRAVAISRIVAGEVIANIITLPILCTVSCAITNGVIGMTWLRSAADWQKTLIRADGEIAVANDTSVERASSAKFCLMFHDSRLISN
jgi:hypothetical protein